MVWRYTNVDTGREFELLTGLFYSSFTPLYLPISKEEEKKKSKESNNIINYYSNDKNWPIIEKRQASKKRRRNERYKRWWLISFFKSSFCLCHSWGCSSHSFKLQIVSFFYSSFTQLLILIMKVFENPIIKWFKFFESNDSNNG